MLPVVVPLAAGVVVAGVWHLRRRGLLTVPRAAVALAMAVYVAGVVANTVFPIYTDKPASSPRWSDFVSVTPLAGYEVVDAVTNVVVFVPVGLLVSLAVPRWSRARALAAAVAVSLSIEVTQYVTAHLLGGGHVADVNDLIFNVVGAAVGLLLLVVVAHVPLGARGLERFRWA
ncbi:VanZ family protein [Nocardioides plantarum]|uniref:VanZ family protein n=1 Tax=Nocardioides plantarum TaxID=29299 RepID=UPI003618B4F9